MPDDPEEHSFSEYKLMYKRPYADNSEEHALREDIFNQRLEEIREHNAQALPWKMGVNALTDRTEEELKMLRGYDRWLRTSPTSPSSIAENAYGPTSCSSAHAACTDTNTKCCDGYVCTKDGVCEESAQPDELDFADRIQGARNIPDQGKCGSCWAFAAISAIQLQAALNEGFTQELSPDGMIKCTPNPRSCGGDGGCTGATAELGFEWLKSQRSQEGGVLSLMQDPYTQTSPGCDYRPSTSKSFLQVKPSEPIVNIKGYVKLTPNLAEPVFKSLVAAGPMVSTVVARDLASYSSGIIHECKDWTVDHAVLLMGYGGNKDDDTLHWKMRNSWGSWWGEQGFFRVKRNYPFEKEPCGVDRNTKVGVACKNANGEYPAEQDACGVCGVLFDTSYPVGTYTFRPGE